MAAKIDRINGKMTKHPVRAEITKPAMAITGFGLNTPIKDKINPTAQTNHPKKGSHPRNIPNMETTNPAVPIPLEVTGSCEKITFCPN
ncbi:hypothetical protein [Echinicola sediminis]